MAPIELRRILIATDVPFWRKSTGAQQRIDALVRYLADESFEIRTFFLGQTGTGQFTKTDRDLIAKLSLDVDQRSSETPPRNILKKVGWYADATLNQLRQLGGLQDKAKSENAEYESLELKDFHWPWAVTAFKESVDDFQPDFILTEYIKLAYLLEGLSGHQRDSVKCLVDTHDVLHLRCQQFHERGFSHWIKIDRSEEAAALAKFDVIVAIQEEEAELFRELSPDNQVIVCGHLPAINPNPPTQSPVVPVNPDVITVGYLASTNDSNLEAIQRFLSEVWEPLSQPELVTQTLRLVIAGSVCSALKNIDAISKMTSLNPNAYIRLVGRVDDVEDFYDSVDLVVNPVEFGTGLKIKTVEAIGFGKPVLSTRQGLAGINDLPQESSIGITICESSEAFKNELKLLVNQKHELAARTVAARQLAQTLFSDHQPYAPLKKCLLDFNKID